MSPEEYDPNFLIAHHYLEKLEDFEYKGKKVPVSRLGWRINERFVHAFFGRVFNHPHAVFTAEMLKPELQDADVFADGLDNIVTTQKRVAKMYFDDGSIAQACPPLKALLHIMLYDQWEGKTLDDPEFRKLFTRESMLASDWYAARLKAKQKVDQDLWHRHVRYLDKFLKRPSHADEAARLHIAERLKHAQTIAEEAASPAYLEKLRGTPGVEPIEKFL
jgi:phosphoenolpyruvate carboxykinase (diphosphate)